MSVVSASFILSRLSFPNSERDSLTTNGTNSKFEPSIDSDSCEQEPIPWPCDIQLYIPTTCQLTADYFGRCLAVAAIFKHCNVDFTIEQVENAEYLAPNKLWPLIRTRDKLGSGFENIVEFVRLMGYLKTSKFTDVQMAEAHALLVYIDSSFYRCERFFCWCDKSEFSNSSAKHFSSHSFILRKILPILRRWDITSQLKTLGYPSSDVGMQRIMGDLRVLCKAIWTKLEPKTNTIDDSSESYSSTFLTGNEMTEVDVVFSCHIQALKMLFPSFPSLSQLFQTEYPGLLQFADTCCQSLDVLNLL